MVSTKCAATLTHRLLAFSRRQMLNPTPTDVNRLVADMEDLFPPYGGDRHPARNQARSRPAANQLESALLNLVLNARDAMPDGGHLLIETANTVFPDSRAEPREPALRHMPGSECVALFVTDIGPEELRGGVVCRSSASATHQRCQRTATKRGVLQSSGASMRPNTGVRLISAGMKGRP
jgi:hypothetical protein